MTSSEAREAAAWHRGRSSDALFAADDDEPEAQRAGIRRIAEMHDRAAVALDAYADGIDGGEWTPIGTSFEFRPTSADTNRLHRIRARLLALVPLDGTMSLADDVQRLDRALADAAAREREACAAMLDERKARLCDAAMQCDRVIGYGSREGSAYLDKAKLAEDLARAIRARGTDGR